MISMAALVSKSEIRTEERAGPRKSLLHCHGPMPANRAVKGYNSATAKSAAPDLAIHLDWVLMQWETDQYDYRRKNRIVSNLKPYRDTALWHRQPTLDLLPFFRNFSGGKRVQKGKQICFPRRNSA
jgi:hypothetical protein